MLSISGAVNIWNNVEELRARQEEGRELARKHFASAKPEEFKKWENRFIHAAQGLSDDYWAALKRMERRMLIGVVDNMVMLGAPWDEPFDVCVSEPGKV